MNLIILNNFCISYLFYDSFLSTIEAISYQTLDLILLNKSY